MGTEPSIPQPERVPLPDHEPVPADPWYEDQRAGDLHIGTVGPYFPYDIEDPRAPIKEKRGPGFVRPDEYIKGGVVKTYKRKRKR